MLNLRKVLLSNYLYITILIIVIIISIIRINYPTKSIYHKNTNNITGIITNIEADGDLLKLTIKAKEKVIAYYYFSSIKSKKLFLNNLELGQTIKVNGKIKDIAKSTTKNTFNYKEYLKRKNIYYTFTIEELTILNKKVSLLYKVKNSIIKRINSLNYSRDYVRLFLLGDNSSIKNHILSSFRENGISHLFAISGMHITILSGILLFLLKKLKFKETKRYLISSICLLSFLLIVGISPSILRAVLFFILFSLNKIFYFYIKPYNLFIIVLCISLLINPFYIFEVAFLYSFLISFSLIICSKYIEKYHNYLIKLLITSIISFLVSFPITAYNFYQINIMSIIYNLFFIPLVSLIIFPLSLITFIFPFLDKVLYFFIYILENISLFLGSINLGKLIFMKMNYFFYSLYFIILVIIFYKRRLGIILFILLIIIHYLYPTIINSNYVVMLDVGQGDSFIFYSKGKTVLLDTGGKASYSKARWQEKEESSIALNMTIPYLKSLGIKKIDYLILTHGDSDHMRESINIIDKFKVNNVLINSNKLNYLEKSVKNKFKKTQEIAKGYSLNIGDYNFLELNKNLGDENDSSLVFYVTIYDYSFLFMGDASVKTEEYLLNTYNLGHVDILKLGHHGSRTSTSTIFLDEIAPVIGLISSGKNNKFKHPHKEIVKRLEQRNIQIFNTKKDGTIKIYLKKDKVIINTYNKIFSYLK